MDRPYVEIIETAFEDERGEIKNILTDPDIGHVAIITSKAKTIRGNHYHPTYWQVIYVVSGGYTARYRKVRRGANNEIEAASEILTAYVGVGQIEVVPPGWAHAYRFSDDTVFLDIFPGGRSDDEPDDVTISYVLLS